MATARSGRRIAFVAPLFGGTGSLEADAARAKSRKEAGLEALLFEGYPIRLWDHYLGPRERHAFVLDLPASEADPVPAARDLVPALGQQLEDRGVALTPDGGTAILSLGVQTAGRPKVDLVAIDTATLEQRVLTPGDGMYDQAAVSPDGRLGRLRAGRPWRPGARRVAQPVARRPGERGGPRPGARHGPLARGARLGGRQPGPLLRRRPSRATRPPSAWTWTMGG